MLTSIGRPFLNVYFSTFEPFGMTPNTIFSELRFVLGGSFVNMRLLIPLPRSSCQEVVGGIWTARDPEFWTGLSDRLSLLPQTAFTPASQQRHRAGLRANIG